jgi:hypothetical protein
MPNKAKKLGANLDPHSIFDAELQRIPAKMRKFLVREPAPSTFEKTWEYFEGAFGMAFDVITKTALANWSGGQLALPLFFLCRHSMELSIKGAIVAYAESAGELPRIEGHGLAQLWNELMRQIQAAGFETDDEWTVYCGKLVQHLHEVDPDGERFRYPTSRKGVAFDFTRVELKELAVAHWHIGMLCDGAIGMLDGLGRQA